MASDLVMKVFSTKAVSGHDWAVVFDRIISKLGLGSVSGEYVLGSADDPIKVEEVTTFLRGKLPRWRGLLVLAFNEPNGLSGRCELLRLQKQRDAKRDGAAAAYRTHELRLSIPAAICTRIGWDTMFDLLMEISAELSACFSFGTTEESHGDPSHAAKGLESGIPGTFPMMVLGPEYVSIIGRDHLLKLSDQQVRCHSGLIGLSIVGSFELPRLELVRRLEVMKSDIGEEYFSDTRPVGLGLGGGQVGVWSLIRSVWRSANDFESSSRLARKRPVLDWGGVFSE